MAAVEIVKNAPVHVKGSVGGPMPNFKADPGSGEPAAPAPPARPPAPAKLAAAPPVPPPTTPSTTVRPVEPHKTPNKDAMFKRMRDKSGIQEPKAEDPPAPTEPKEPTEPAEPTEPTEEPTEPTEPTTAEPGKTDEKGKTRVSPWKLVDEWKTKYAEVEKQLLETKKLIPDELGRKTEVERFTAAEKRAQELEQEIRYVNYAKSQEFQEKYQKPYEEAWQRAMVEMQELAVSDPETGESRKASANDLLEVVNAPLIKAKQMAQEKFGDFADEVMSHRKEVRRLFEEQSAALKRAREEGGEREKTIQSQQQAMLTELQSHAKSAWEKAQEASLSDPENGAFFKPVEGDDERNNLLQRGYEFVDTSTQENPLDPRLTPEQRATVVKKHVAVRNRAAAYGVIKHEFKKLQAKYSAIEKKLQQYEASTPTIEGGARTQAQGTNGKAWDRSVARLRALARGG